MNLVNYTLYCWGAVAVIILFAVFIKIFRKDHKKKIFWLKENQCRNCYKMINKDDGTNGTPQYFVSQHKRVCKECFDLIGNDNGYLYKDAHKHLDKFPRIYDDKKENERMRKYYMEKAKECGQI